MSYDYDQIMIKNDCHPWCRAVQRDEAVRAAEENRSGPLPTLEEAIAMIPKTASASSTVEQENKGDRMGTKAEIQAAAYRAEAIARAGQFADSEAPQGPKCTERESGLRTERVTLEITYDNGMFGWSPPGTWAWPEMLKHRTESVRVVEEAATFSAACPIAGGTVKVNRQDMVTLTEFLRHTTKLTQEAGVAKRQLEDVRKEYERRLTMCERMKQERDQANFHVAIVQARVAELEQARERFDTALEEARTRSGINDFIVQRDEALEELETAIRERDELRRALLVENDHALRIKDERDAAEAANASWCKAAGIMNARVAELEAAAKLAPAATADGGSNHAAPAASVNSQGILDSSPAASGAAGNSPESPVSSENEAAG